MREELWINIRHLRRSLTNKSDNYDGKYFKIKFNSSDNLHLKKTVELCNMIMIVKYVFHD